MLGHGGSDLHKGTFGNLGNYSLGIPIGMMVDKYGSRPGSTLGALCLGMGYFALWRCKCHDCVFQIESDGFAAYNTGADATTMSWLCLFSYLTGVGSLSAFLGSVKTGRQSDLALAIELSLVAAMNWPHHRGTAVAFPMAGYGLSAFLFSAMSHLAFPEDTSGLLLLFTIATASMIAVGGVFLRIVPQAYSQAAKSSQTELKELKASVRAEQDEGHRLLHDSGAPHDSVPRSGSQSKNEARYEDLKTPDSGDEDDTSLLSSQSETCSEDIAPERGHGVDDNDLRHLDIRGLRLLSMAKFWQIWIVLGLLTGIGLMTIK